MILLANTTATLMFLAGVGMLTMILLRRSHRYFGRRTRKGKSEPAIQAQPRPNDAWSGMHKDAAAHIQRQQVEMHDMARDATGELNSKMLVLQELLSRSDQQITRMENLLDELNESPA